MSASESFALSLLVVFSAPYLVWRLLKTDRVAPLVVVQIVGGVLLGPGVLGRVAPAAYGAVFTPVTVNALNGVASWGVMLYVWVAGTELDLAEAWRRRGETGLVAGFALAVPLLFGTLAAAALVATSSGWVGAKGSPWQAVLGLGMGCAVTALPILVLLLDRLEILRTPFGQRVLRYASVDDVAIWAVLAVILLDGDRIGRQAGFLAGFPIAALTARRLMARLAEPDRWPVGLIFLAGSAFAADACGLHFMVGAFLSGAVLDRSWFDPRRLDAFRDALLLAIMPVFFLSTGLRTRWDLGGLAVFGAAALFLAAAVLGKLAGVAAAGRILKWRPGEAGLIGWLLQTKALIMIIFSNILLDRGIITNAAFTAQLLMAVASTVLTTPLVQPRLRRLRDVLRRPA